jgi:hypothetical protein
MDIPDSWHIERRCDVSVSTILLLAFWLVCENEIEIKSSIGKSIIILYKLEMIGKEAVSVYGTHEHSRMPGTPRYQNKEKLQIFKVFGGEQYVCST